MNCPRCGHEVPDGARFCPTCGVALTAVMPAPTEIAPAASIVEIPASAEPAPPSAYDPPPAMTPAATISPTGVLETGPAMTPTEASAEGGSALGGVPPSMLPQGTVPVMVVAPPFAGFWRRAFACIVDGILINILLSPLYFGWVWPALTASSADRSPDEMDPAQAFAIMGTMMGYVLVAAVLETIYYAALDSSSYQASLGKMAFGIRITDLEGRRISFGRALLRRLARIVTAFTIGIGFLMVLWTRRRQTLHDMMVGTLVVRR